MRLGFTLIELVIVIGILAILATAVVLVLNPAQLLAEARDSQRMSDLTSIKSAVALYLITATSPTVGAGSTCTADNCDIGGPFGGETVNSSTALDSTGWVQIDLEATPDGSPLSSLPLDPVNSGNYFYGYKGDTGSNTFEIDSRLESIKYRDAMINDGGDKSDCSTSYTAATCYYELGTAPGLSL